MADGGEKKGNCTADRSRGLDVTEAQLFETLIFFFRRVLYYADKVT